MRSKLTLRSKFIARIVPENAKAGGQGGSQTSQRRPPTWKTVSDPPHLGFCSSVHFAPFGSAQLFF